MKTKPRIGVVLSSGGIRGVYAHTGFMQALQQMDIQYKAIAGCSAGAIVGGILASGTTLDIWSKKLEKMKSQDYWKPYSIVKFLNSHLLHKGRGYLGFANTDAALQFTLDNLHAKTFQDCVIPFSSLAINLVTGEKEIFSEGELAKHIVASAAVPVLYDPVDIDGVSYCDGAIVDFAPTDAICCKYNLDIVFVHHVAQSDGVDAGIDSLKQQSWPLLEIINHLLFLQRPWYLSSQPLNINHCPCGCGARIISLEPDLPKLHWPSVVGGDDVLRAAYNQALQYITPEINRVMTSARKTETEQMKNLNIEGC